MLGIERLSRWTVSMVGRNTSQQPLIHSPSSQPFKQKRKYLLSLSLPPLHYITCGCHSARPVPNADATLPQCCRASHPAALDRPRRKHFSPLPVTRAGAGGACPLVARAARPTEPRAALVCTCATGASARVFGDLGTQDRRVMGWSYLCLGYKRGVCFRGTQLETLIRESLPSRYGLS